MPNPTKYLYASPITASIFVLFNSELRITNYELAPTNPDLSLKKKTSSAKALFSCFCQACLFYFCLINPPLQLLCFFTAPYSIYFDYILSATKSPISEQVTFLQPSCIISPVRKPPSSTLFTASSIASASFAISKE